METLGNVILLDRHRFGFLAGSKIAALSVLPTLDWASEVSVRKDVSVVSGFHSQLERQVLDLLLKGKCGIICVLARSLYAKIPLEFQSAFTGGRVIFVSEERQVRPTKNSAYRRNQLVVSLSDELVIPQISSESSLHPIITSFTKTISIL
ncbi:hypothetical protein E7745_00405 [Duncaniella sp. C9]|uniref:hypothetical protein n=1 Tax=unclassified Duncaniella TaxID=2649562 RepID=UPI0010A2F32B|nr:MULTISPECIES: hypothetical protein [unclassified Duncaniella]QCD38123.1 hypothetical protein E7745_00405 [Duncaniella sp. C9]QCP71805.1 hypothetical protein FDZ78_04110 [Duncaniella sp. B8]